MHKECLKQNAQVRMFFFLKDEQNWQPKRCLSHKQSTNMPTCPTLLNVNMSCTSHKKHKHYNWLEQSYWLHNCNLLTFFFLFVFFCSRAVTRRKQLKQSKCQCLLWWWGGGGGGQIVSGGRLSLKPEKKVRVGDGMGALKVSQNWGGGGGGEEGGQKLPHDQRGGGRGGLSPTLGVQVCNLWLAATFF